MSSSVAKNWFMIRFYVQLSDICLCRSCSRIAWNKDLETLADFLAWYKEREDIWVYRAARVPGNETSSMLSTVLHPSKMAFLLQPFSPPLGLRMKMWLTQPWPHQLLQYYCYNQRSWGPPGLDFDTSPERGQFPSIRKMSRNRILLFLDTFRIIWPDQIRPIHPWLCWQKKYQCS